MQNHQPAASRPKFHRSLRAALSALTLILAVPVAQAATFTVTNNNDAGAGSLRDAIAQANALAGADSINFDPTVFATPVNSQIILTSGELVVSDDVTIDATNLSDRLFVSGNNSSRVMNLAAGAATLNDLFLFSGNNVTNGGCLMVQSGAALLGNNTQLGPCTATGAVAGEGGGGIFNAGTVDVTRMIVFSSRVTGAAGNGGGILNSASGSLTLSNVGISGNSANRAGGGIENAGGTVVLTFVNFDNNTVGTAPGNGGGMHSGGGSVTINGGSFRNNTAGREGGGLWAAGTSLIQPDSRGGTVFSDNVANGTGPTNGGGGLFNQGGTMTVVGATFTRNLAIQGSGSGGGILNNVVDGSAVLMVTDSSFDINDANRAGGAIEDNGGTVTLTNVTMTDNTAGLFGSDATPGNGGGLHSGGGGTITINGGEFTVNRAASEGGAIWTSGPATLTDVTVTNNLAFGDAADNGGGGLFNQGGSMTVQGNSLINLNAADGVAGSGGGIFNNGGTLNVSGASILSNSAMRAGGGLEDVSGVFVTLSNVTMNDNTATGGPDGAETATDGAPGNGGAVHISGTGNMTVSGSMFANNFAAAEGGGLWNSGGESSLTISGSTLDGNFAAGDAPDQGGGGLFNNGGVLTVNAILESVPGSDVMVTPTRIINNEAFGAAGSGGGILNDGGTLVVSDTELSNNFSVRAGGGIEDDATGGNATTTTLTRVTMDSNITGGTPGNGGATHVTGPGTITIDSSTVSNNMADNEGGGLWNHNSSTLNIVNSTISGNEAPLGGGVFTQNGSAATVNITNATIANNTSRGIEAAGSNAASINLTNTIVADNSGGDISAAVTANFSVIENVSGATINGGNNVTGMDPLLAALSDNGGPTLTQLTTSGPAIDAASNGSCPSADQRGVDRPIDGNGDGAADCDIGAVEFADGPVAAVTVVSGDGETTFAEIGDENVPATGIAYQNTSDESITVSSIAGRVNGGRLSNVSEVSVLVDGLEVPAMVSFNRATGNFSAAFPGGRTVQANDGSTITVALSFDSSTAVAGIGLLGLLLLGATLISRRSRTFAAMLIAGTMSIACSNSDNFNDSEDDQTYSVTVTRIVATGDNTNAGVAAAALPVTGGDIQLQF